MILYPTRYLNEKKIVNFLITLIILSQYTSPNSIHAQDLSENSIFNCGPQKSEKINYELIIDDFYKSSKLWLSVKNYRWYLNDLFLVQYCFDHLERKKEYEKLVDQAFSKTITYDNLKNYRVNTSNDKNGQERFLKDLEVLVGQYAVYLMYEDDSEFDDVYSSKGWAKLKNILYLSTIFEDYQRVYSYSQKLNLKKANSKIITEYKNFLEKTVKKKKDPIDEIFLGVSFLRLYSVIDRKYCNEFIDNSIFKRLDYKTLKFFNNENNPNNNYDESRKYNAFKDYFKIGVTCSSMNMDIYLNRGQKFLEFLEFSKINYSAYTDLNIFSDYLNWHNEMMYQYSLNKNFTKSDVLRKNFFKEVKMIEKNLDELSLVNHLVNYQKKILKMDKKIADGSIDEIYKLFNKVNYDNWFKFYSKIADKGWFEAEKNKTLVKIYSLETEILFLNGRYDEAAKINKKMIEVLDPIVIKNIFKLPNIYDSLEAKTLLNAYNDLITIYRLNNNLEKIRITLNKVTPICDEMINQKSLSVIICGEIIQNISPVLSYFKLEEYSLEDRLSFYKKYNQIFNFKFSEKSLDDGNSIFNVLLKKEILRTRSSLISSITAYDKNYKINQNGKDVLIRDIMCENNKQNFEIIEKNSKIFTVNEVLGGALANLGCINLDSQLNDNNKKKNEKLLTNIEVNLIKYLEIYKKEQKSLLESQTAYLNYRNIDQGLIIAVAIGSQFEDYFSNKAKLKIKQLTSDFFEILQTQYNLSNFAAKKNYILNYLQEEDQIMFVKILDLNRKQYQIKKRLVNVSFDKSHDLRIQSELIQKEIAEVSKKLEKKLPKFKKISLSNIQNKLKNDEAIVTFNWTTGFFISSVITKDDFTLLDKNIPELNRALNLLRNITNIQYTKEDPKESLKFAGETFLNDINQILKNKQISNVFFVTDENTSSFPLESFIVNSNNELKYFIELYNVSYLPSLQSFLNKDEIKINIANTDKYLGIGNPKFTESNSNLNLEKISFTRGGYINNSKAISQTYEELPFTEKEINKISTFFVNNEKLLGQNANETNIKNILKENYDIIQFATHAEVVGNFDNFDEPYIVLTPPNIPSKKDDGLLSLSEIYKLKLDTKLVILSACNTATKVNEFANGFDGIVSAFIDAGAKNVIATHWPVEDNASYLIISETIKKSIKQNISLSESLKKTKIDFINGKYGEDFKHPFFWSPFIILG